MLKGFRDFLMRGNVIDLAVAVVIGAAFGAVVSAFANDFIGGVVAGTALQQRLPARWIGLGFAAFLVVSAIDLLA